MDETDIAIIGAGPHGLAAAAHLRRAGVECRVIGEPMSFWRTMPKGMLLRSNSTATCIAEYDGPLSLDSYMAATERSVQKPFPLQDFLDYGDWVANQVAPDADRRRVLRVDRDSDGFLLSFDTGEPLRARRVVVAAGIADFPRRPEIGAGLPPNLVSHTADHADFNDWGSSKVLVVGGGQSALESAALLHEAGAEVSVAMRAPHINWLHGGKYYRKLGRMAPLVYAPTDVGPMGLSRIVAVPGLFRRFPRSLQDPLAYRAIRPAGAAWLKPRLENVPVHFGRTVRDVRSENSHVSVTFDTGQTQSVDHVLFGTGYQIDISRYGFLSPDLLRQIGRVNGYPVLGKGMEATVPGLHFLGATAAYSWGPTMRFVAGGWFGAESLTRAVAAGRLSGRSAASPKLNGAARVRESGRTAK
ncbi:thioredoxin reductase [Mycobacterium frederiksbergense]|uniref:Thioredoxin reductase n=1 Tax=Mycolicibacterium frederiksbergense TaxID=117567 RepID=A0ABT6KZU3_9MYCO|nr:NAD(P)-binding domain-containing protein [Mycolicibacterium frederiksbergense]MDH6196223.1 thioredoxin reductase [Mycolicibacterium frederiksbergense]